MKIHPAYIHSLGDSQPRVYHRLHVVGLEPPIPAGAYAACVVVGVVLVALALGLAR